MIENIEVLFHSSIRINKDKVIYIDPFKVNKSYNDADLIFITHDHFDHYSEEDIDKVIKEDTILIAPESMISKLLNNGIKKEQIVAVKQNEKKEINSIKFETIPAYNINKQFHPKENGWVGYIIEIDNIRYYIAGDTDITNENKQVKCEVALVPVGGTYTMNYVEAAKLINEIKPKIAIPIHYGSVAGTKEDGINFVNLINNNIKAIELLK